MKSLFKTQDWFRKLSVLVAAVFLTATSCGKRSNILNIDGDRSEDQSVEVKSYLNNQGLLDWKFVLQVDKNLSSEYILALDRAMDTWNKAIGFPLILRGSAVSFDDNSDDLYMSLQDGQNGIDVKRTWPVKRSHAIATTVWKTNSDGDGPSVRDQRSYESKVIQADIHLNVRHFNFVDTSQIPSEGDTGDKNEMPNVDAESLFLHELGHCIGLSDLLWEQDAVMYQGLEVGGQHHRRQLSDSDIAHVQSLYPISQRP